MKIKNIIVLYCLIGFSVLIGCKNNEAINATKKAAIEVSVASITKQNIEEFITFNGVTVYQSKEDIRSNVTGYISSLRYKIGDEVRVGQVFAYVRTKEQDALKDAVKIDSSLAKFISPISIKSNGTGIIKTLNINKNDYVVEGDVIASIIQPNSLVVQVSVPYEYETDVTINTACEIWLPNGEKLSAKITDKLPTVDAASQSQTFIIKLYNPKDLPENLNVQVKIIQEESSDLLTVPKRALQTNELLTEFWVMKITNDSLAVKTIVTIGLKNDSIVQVNSNVLKLNDLLITTGAYQMQDSTIVKYKRK